MFFLIDLVAETKLVAGLVHTDFRGGGFLPAVIQPDRLGVENHNFGGIISDAGLPATGDDGGVAAADLVHSVHGFLLVVNGK